MKPRVCILTSGIGSRMGSYAKVTNKALLPLGIKAILTHIIEKFPRDLEFVISLGHCGDDVRSYLELAHPDRRFHYVVIDNITGPGSGPGYSLLKCKDELPGPFFFVSCDTLWHEPFDVMGEPSNWFGASAVAREESRAYCNFKVDRGAITEVRDKEEVGSDEWRAFTGLCRIEDTETFWKGLQSKDLVQSEAQISRGLKALVATGVARAREMKWIDVGDEAKYKRIQAAHFADFDFSKMDEFVYIVGDRVIKFFKNPVFAAKRAQRARLRPAVFPKIADERPGWYSYRLVEGKTLYQYNDVRTFGALLNWLAKELWQKVEVDPSVALAASRDFYKTKTLQRIELYRKKHSVIDAPVLANGVTLVPLDSLLEKVPWEVLTDIVPVFFHGDLQFDNILIDPATKKFCLLDWRQDFAGHVEFGDQYYDFAKLLGGIYMNYDLIKKGLFRYREEEGEIFYDHANWSAGRDLEKVLERFIESRGFDFKRVRLLTALIFLNMSPLHHEPWDRLLYVLGRRKLQEILE